MIGYCYWLVFIDWCCSDHRDYSWKLNKIILMRIVIRKERKYSLIKPFWFVTTVDIFVWVIEMVFGKIVSNQIRSRREDADFWLIVRFV